MRTRARLAAVLACLLAASAAWAQQYPSRPIHWVVPYAPGGITDSVTRIVANKLEAALGQPIVIENKPGANSIVGVESVARSAPDGYTALTVIAAHAANATLYTGKLAFDPEKSFAPSSLAGVPPHILTGTNVFPAAHVTHLIEDTL